MSEQSGRPEDQDFRSENDFLAPLNRTSKKQMKRWWIKTTALLLLVVFSVVLLFTIGDLVSAEDTPQLRFVQLIRLINYPLFALLLSIILSYILVESFKYAWMLKISTGKFYLRTSIKTMFLGKYYDGITPLSTGGQPFQIMYLHKKDIPRGIASAIPLMRYLVSSVVMTAFAAVLLALTPHFVPGRIATVALLAIACVSLVINALVPVTIILFTVSPVLSTKIMATIIHVLYKLRIVKNRYATMKKTVRDLREYSEAIRMFTRKTAQMIPLILLSIAETFLYLAIPFFVVIAIADVPPTAELLVQILCLSVITRYTSLLLPTPGNTGAVEATSSLIFITVAGIDAYLGWVVLVWRFLTYYIYILSGIGINIFEIIRSAVRSRRQRHISGSPPPEQDASE